MGFVRSENWSTFCWNGSTRNCFHAPWVVTSKVPMYSSDQHKQRVSQIFLSYTSDSLRSFLSCSIFVDVQNDHVECSENVYIWHFCRIDRHHNEKTWNEATGIELTKLERSINLFQFSESVFSHVIKVRFLLRLQRFVRLRMVKPARSWRFFKVE